MVITISLADLALGSEDTQDVSAPDGQTEGGGSSLQVVAALRMLRVLKLLRLAARVPALQLVILVMLHALPALINAGALLLAVLAGAALAGASLFGGLLGGECFAVDSGRRPPEDSCTCLHPLDKVEATASLPGYQCLDLVPREVKPRFCALALKTMHNTR